MRRGGCASALLFLIAIAGAAWLFGEIAWDSNKGGAPIAADVETETMIAAWSACRRAAMHSLHDPDSAEMDPVPPYVVKRTGANAATAQVGLRARNGFNALRHLTVECSVAKVGGHWVATSTKLL